MVCRRRLSRLGWQQPRKCVCVSNPHADTVVRFGSLRGGSADRSRGRRDLTIVASVLKSPARHRPYQDAIRGLRYQPRDLRSARVIAARSANPRRGHAVAEQAPHRHDSRTACDVAPHGGLRHRGGGNPDRHPAGPSADPPPASSRPRDAALGILVPHLSRDLHGDSLTPGRCTVGDLAPIRYEYPGMHRSVVSPRHHPVVPVHRAYAVVTHSANQRSSASEPSLRTCRVASL